MLLQINQTEHKRRRVVVGGQVQGVGFRPFVFRLASEMGLAGFVRNNGAGVVIEAQGAGDVVDRFISALCQRAPALAVVDRLAIEERPLADLEHEFRIAGSEKSHGQLGAGVTPDAAVCDACIAEMKVRGNGREGYGLINCTECGPRYSIVQRVPYDRQNTTMAEFAMCGSCRSEYDDPEDRRFHAQPIACERCGPKVTFADPGGTEVEGAADPYSTAADHLLKAEIVAIKGLGGYHLAVRADSAAGVARLRRLKHRDAKPFAVMCRSLAQAQELVELSMRAVKLLQSPACPIVLAPRNRGLAAVVEGVAPGSHRLGVMVPYTPVQHLLFAAMGERAMPLVMTSGNVGEEPLVFDDDDVVTRLGGMCDGILWHNRPIARGVDDSVVIDLGPEHHTIMVRRARGYVPAPVKLPTHDLSSGLAVGGEMKCTVAVIRDGEAILSQHLGDLSHPRSYHAFRQAIGDLSRLFDVKPTWVARDMHPGYLSTAHADKVARDLSVAVVAVQHHHAHAASVMAENGITGPVLAVVCDGTGYGPDGTVWGGELLVADLVSYKRLARLRPIRLPGGDASAKDPRRSALAVLHQVYGEAFEALPAAQDVLPAQQERRMLGQMIVQGVSCVASSSSGRLFDAAAALLGICVEQTYEAQAAMALESAALGHLPRDDRRPLFRIHKGKVAQIDLSLLFHTLVDKRARGVEVNELAGLFHEQFCQAWCAVVMAAVEKTGLVCAALSGGVFCNAIVAVRMAELLRERGIHVIHHRTVPPNDGGLALGQAAVANARAARGLIGKAGA